MSDFEGKSEIPISASQQLGHPDDILSTWYPESHGHLPPGYPVEGERQHLGQRPGIRNDVAPAVPCEQKETADTDEVTLLFDCLFQVLDHVTRLKKEDGKNEELATCSTILQYAVQIFSPLAKMSNDLATQVTSNLQLLQTTYDQWLINPNYDLLSLDCMQLCQFGEALPKCRAHQYKFAIDPIAWQIVEQIEKTAREFDAGGLREILDAAQATMKWQSNKLENDHRMESDRKQLDQLKKGKNSDFYMICQNLMTVWASKEAETWQVLQSIKANATTHPGDQQRTNAAGALKGLLREVLLSIYSHRIYLFDAFVDNVEADKKSTLERLSQIDAQLATESKAALIAESWHLFVFLRMIVTYVLEKKPKPVGDYGHVNGFRNSLVACRKGLSELRLAIEKAQDGPEVEDAQSLPVDVDELKEEQDNVLAAKVSAQLDVISGKYDSVVACLDGLTQSACNQDSNESHNEPFPKLSSFKAALEALIVEVNGFEQSFPGVNPHVKHPPIDVKKQITDWQLVVQQLEILRSKQQSSSS